MVRNAAKTVAKLLRHTSVNQYHSLGSAMGPILRLIFVGALGLLILMPLWGGSAADSLVAGSRDGKLLSRIGLRPDFCDGVITRLQEVRNEIHDQQCERGAQTYCMLGRCWTTAAPHYCGETAKANARLGQASVGR